jgi:hypothetical protein
MADRRQPTTGVPAKCPKCGAPVGEWPPDRIKNRLAITLLPCRHEFNDVEIIFPVEGKRPE